MEKIVRSIQSYKKTPTIQVPATPDFISPFLSQSALSSSNSGASPSVQSSPEDPLASSSSTPLSPLSSPFSNPGESSSQPRLIQAPQDKTQKLQAKFERMEEILGDSASTPSVNSSRFYFTTLLAVLERKILAVLLMV